jgi:P4 family phage/plasmid primase-like protien
MEHARRFIEILAGSADAPVTWQQFYDPKGPEYPKQPGLAAHYVGSLDQMGGRIVAAQQHHCGIYICLNETDGVGRHNVNVKRFRGVFADFDGMEEPTWPVTPHMVTKRDETHGHAFWLVSDITTPEQFRALQKQVQLCCGTDPQVTDPARVVRVPDFWHYKNPASPQRYRITVDNPLPHYTVSDIITGFSLDATQEAALASWLGGRTALKDGAEFEDTEYARKKFISWLGRAETAVEGEGATNRVIMVASFAWDYGLHLETAQELMRKYYDPRCEPSWAETGEIDDFNELVARAYRYARNAPGCRTPAAVFAAVGDVPAPPDGWDANAKLPEPPSMAEAPAPEVRGSLTADEGAAMLATVTGKTASWDMARVFLAIKYPGDALIRNQKTFYEFTGKAWSEVTDETIKSQIAWFYEPLRLANSAVKAVLDSLCDYVHERDLENGTWMDGSMRDGSETTVFDNTLVTVSAGHATVAPHTRDFFTLNAVDYPFEPAAECPTWLAFLESIWPGESDIKQQLQEWMGYLLTNDIRQQKFALFMGKSRAGKGVISSVITALVGPHNTVAPSLEDLVTPSVLHSMSTATVAMIPDAHDVAPGMRNKVLSKIKAITGGDMISFHVMYKGARADVFPTRIILSTNNMPEFVDASGALANRMLVFPFTRSFAGCEDKQLTARLLSEISGVANWALRGLQSLQARGKFIDSARAVESLNDLRDDMDPLSEFIEDYCVLDYEAKALSTTLHSAYRLWATLQGIDRPMDVGRFSKALRNSRHALTYGRPTVDGMRGRGFIGLGLQQHALDKLAPANVVDFPAVK